MFQSEYLSIRQYAQCVGMSHRTLEGAKSQGYLPPHFEFTKRAHRWKRSDIEAWASLKQRGLFDDWLELRAELGPIEAWALMLKRLDEAA